MQSKWLPASSLKDLFGSVNPYNIVDYLKDVTFITEYSFITYCLY